MAATIHRLRCVRSMRCNSCYSIRAFSSGNELPPSFTDNLRSEPGTKQSVASYVKEVKASLKSESPPQARQSPSRPSAPSEASQPNQVPSFDELRRNLSGFRRNSAPQPSSSDSDQFVSFQELYKRSVTPNPGDSAAPSTAVKPSFDAIRESLKRLREKPPPSTQGGSGAREKLPGSTQGGSGVSTVYPMSLERLKESLKTRPDQTTGVESPGISSPFSLEDKKLSENGSKTTYMRTYGYPELGEELKRLRPENKKGKWFSLHELNERLVKLKKKESKKLHGLLAGEIRDTLDKLRHSSAETKRVQKVQRLDHLAVFGGTPKYLLSPPKEHLVDKYFHPDNMSSAEKLKLELKQVREEFKMSESDCGSARVQVAQLTTKIKHLAKVLTKKDKHSRKGLQDMVQRRKKLLKYLRRTDWDSYCLVLSKLGLRDKPDLVKA